MTKPRKTYNYVASAREAVARVFGYEPQDISLSEILRHQAEAAEVALDNAKSTGRPDAEVEALQLALDEALEDEELARDLLIELLTAADELAAARPHPTLVLSTAHSSGKGPYFTKASLYYWAKARLNQEFAEWKLFTAEATAQPAASPLERNQWEKVTIDFRSGNKLHIRLPDGGSKTTTLENAGLFNLRNRDRMNTKGVALLRLATASPIFKKRGKSGTGISGKDLSNLRSILRELTGLTGDPFEAYNKPHGWKPRFKVRDRRKAADERAEKAANMLSPDRETIAAGITGAPSEVYQPHASEYPFDAEDDDAAQFIKDNGQ